MKSIALLSKVSLDIIGDKIYLGGPASYCGRQLSQLSEDFHIYAMANSNFYFRDYYEKNIRNFSIIESPETTTFKLTLEEGKRVVKTISKGDDFKIDLIPDELLSSKIILLSPIVNDMSLSFLRELRNRTKSMIIIDPFNNDSGSFNLMEIELFDNLEEICDIVKMSDNEFISITKQENVVDGFKRVNPQNIILVTAGEKGTYVYNKGKIILVPTFKVVEVIDTVGCGDIFLAGFSFYLNQGNSIEDAVLFGNTCATLSVSGKGVNSILDKETIFQEFNKLRDSLDKNKEIIKL